LTLPPNGRSMPLRLKYNKEEEEIQYIQGKRYAQKVSEALILKLSSFGNECETVTLICYFNLDLVILCSQTEG
jgi:hypothetical protein